jgi:hypothetical protein
VLRTSTHPPGNFRYARIVICKYLAIKTLRGKKNCKTAKPKVFKCENEKILKDIKEEKMKKNYIQVNQFKITLKGIKPPIWRRIQIPETYTFWELHLAIQNAIG